MRDQLITDMATQLAKRPDKAGQVRRSTATLLSWNPAELRGSVDWNGTIIHDIPVVGAIDAFSWAAGDEVVVDSIPGTDGGFSSPTILGRVLRPSADSAAKVLQGLKNEFASQISGEIFAARITAAEDLGPDVTTDSGYQDLGGPEVTVDISEIGRAVVMLSAAANCEHDSVAGGAFASIGARMSFEVTGATTQAPSNGRSVAFTENVLVANEVHSIESTFRQGTSAVVEGLNPGTHTFKTLYARLFVDRNVTFTDRTLVVIAF